VRTNIAPPIVVELGRIPRADVKRLRRGDGPLADDVQETMRLLRLKAGPDSADRVFLPVVVLYTKARRK
jgi:hypothetical protein